MGPKEITIKVHHHDARRIKVPADTLVVKLTQRVKSKFSIAENTDLWYKKSDGKMACLTSVRLAPELQKNGLKLWCLTKGMQPSKWN